MSTKARKISIEESSGNVFADIGVTAPEEALAKAKLAARISEIIKRRRWTQTQAAAFLKIDQPKVSAISHGRLSGFSTDRLLKFLTVLGSDIEIIIRDKPRAKKPGRIRVTTAGNPCNTAV